ncbi:MAG: F0F1 ATP synthase subunit I [Gammaproteobacteria bacterium]|nr:F0F1 ATP synthase subunit I [Gammaproteobacteria bacterium]
MENTVTTIPKPELLKATLYQIAALLLVVAFIGMTDKLMAVSALMGGLIQILPQAWFSWQAFKYAGASNVDKVVQSMYRGELGKVVMTATLFAILFTVDKQWNYIALFTTFLLMIPLQWFLTQKALRH